MSGRAPHLILLLAVAAVAVALAVSNHAVPTVEGQETVKYLGSGKCKACHNKPHGDAGFNPWTAWQEMKHSKAWESLSAEQKAFDAVVTDFERGRFFERI